LVYRSKTSGVGEELVWRGYILNRVADLIGRSRLGWTVSIGIVSVVFGLAHFNQGWTGIIENSIDGALLAPCISRAVAICLHRSWRMGSPIASNL
jgi:membrane protease YdiL (CAAX protease family)